MIYGVLLGAQPITHVTIRVEHHLRPGPATVHIVCLLGVRANRWGGEEQQVRLIITERSGAMGRPSF